MNAPIRPPKLHVGVAGDERKARLGHGPAVIVLEGEGRAARAAFAATLERRLFDAGVHAVALAGNVDYSHTASDQARALALAGLVAIVTGDRRTRMARAQPGIPVIVVDVESRGLNGVLLDVMHVVGARR
jgi:hypothetical protein